MGCNRFTGVHLDPEGDPDNDVSPIVLVKRGNCSFVRKARNIQELGGALTLVADFRDMGDPEKMIMVDDGTGVNIAIPTILISKEDGLKFEQAVNDTEKTHKRQDSSKEFFVLIVDFEMVLITTLF